MKEKNIKEEMQNEKEYKPQDNPNALAEEIKQKVQEAVDDILKVDPAKLTKAIGIIIPRKGSKELFILCDPGTRDVIAELRRYHANGEKPLDALFKSIFSMKYEINKTDNKRND